MPVLKKKNDDAVTDIPQITTATATSKGICFHHQANVDNWLEEDSTSSRNWQLHYLMGLKKLNKDIRFKWGFIKKYTYLKYVTQNINVQTCDVGQRI